MISPAQSEDSTLKKNFDPGETPAQVQSPSQGHEPDEKEEDKVDLVIFLLGDDCFALYGKDVKEILTYDHITFVPGCPEFIHGIINVRGDIESVLNLHKIMGISAPQLTKKSRIIIAAKDDIRSGILVDSVEDVIPVPVSAIERPISTLEKSIKELTVGGETIYQNRYVTILDVGKVFGKIRP